VIWLRENWLWILIAMVILWLLMKLLEKKSDGTDGGVAA
jgi:hypothetical protein